MALTSDHSHLIVANLNICDNQKKIFPFRRIFYKCNLKHNLTDFKIVNEKQSIVLSVNTYFI